MTAPQIFGSMRRVDYSFSQHFGQQVRTNAFADVASKIPSMPLDHGESMDRFQSLVRLLKSEIQPYLADKYCPSFLKSIDEKISEMIGADGTLRHQVKDKLMGPSFDYFFTPISDLFEYKGQQFRPSLFIADALTLLTSLDEQTEKIMAIRHGVMPQLAPRELVLNNTVVSSLNTYNESTGQYDSIMHEENMTPNILIQDDDSAVIMSHAYLQGIQSSSHPSHPISRAPLSKCSIHMLVPVQDRSFIGIHIPYRFISYLNEWWLSLKDMAEHSLFINIDAPLTGVHSKYYEKAREWMRSSSDIDAMNHQIDDPLTQCEKQFDRELKKITHSFKILTKMHDIQSNADLVAQLEYDASHHTRNQDTMKACLMRYLELLHIKNAGRYDLDLGVESVPNNLWDLFKQLKGCHGVT